MRSITSSAPGKLVLLGEYSVLFGHPAVVMAVDARARVRLVADDHRQWSVVAPGFEDHPAVFDLDGNLGFRWREPGSEAASRLVLVQRVLESLVASKFVDPDAMYPATLTLDTGDFFRQVEGGSIKLGLGSSAALTVALTGAMRHRQAPTAGSPSVDLGQLLDSHRSFQRGRGSGIDLAASLLGGVIEYRLVGDDQRPCVDLLELPEDLQLVYLWTGRSASTAVFLRRLEHKMADDDGTVMAALAELGRVSSDGIEDLRSGDLSSLLQRIGNFGDAMERLGHAAGMPILSDEHRRLRRLAHEVGVQYKPSGAGGGDVGIGFSDDPARAAQLAARAADAGFPSLGLKVDPVGLDCADSEEALNADH